MKERYWKYSLIVFIIGLGYLLFRQAQPFMNGILEDLRFICCCVTSLSGFRPK